MALDGAGRDSVLLCRPGKNGGGSIQLRFSDLFLVKISLADDEKVAGRVVTGCGIADEQGISQLVDVPVAVNAEVISDVDPPLRTLVVLLVLAQPGRCIAVVPKHNRGVVNRHAVERVRCAARAGCGGAPSVPAQDLMRR